MKIAFVQTEINEYFGPMVISSVLKRAGHEVDLFIPKLEDDFDNVLKIFKPDIVACSSMTGIHVEDLKILKQVKSIFPGALSILGGIHPTFQPDIVEAPELDIICRGEGERAIVELAEKVDKGEDYSTIKNLWVKKNGEVIKNEIEKSYQDVTTLPFPDREIYYKYKTLRNNPAKRFMAGRGCPFDCTFCFNHKYIELYKQNDGKQTKGYIRIIEPEKFVEEILEVKEKYGLGTPLLVDDIFILKKDWLDKFVEIYPKKVGLKYNCYVRADLLTEDLVVKLKESGCREVDFGVESGNEEFRQKILKKKLSDKSIFEGSRLLKKHGVMFQTTNMIGLPGETVDDAISTIELNAKIKADFTSANVFQPIPGTELTEKAIKEKLLDVPIEWDRSPPSAFSSSILTNMENIKQLENIQKLFYLGVKFPSLIPLIRFISQFNILTPIFFLIFLFLHGYKAKYVYNLDLKFVFRRGLELLTIFKKKADATN